MRPALRREAPWLAAVALGVVWLTWASRSATHWPVGSDWHQYIAGAWALRDPELAALWPDWRRPAYSWALGVLTPGLGPLAAARMLALASGAVVVASAGGIARALAGPAAGALAAAVAATAPVVVAGSGWLSPYPALAAATGASLALGAGAWQRRSTGLAVAAGLAAGLAWALDVRGAVAAVGVLAAAAGHGGWRRAAAGAAALAMVAAVAPTGELPLADQVAAQRSLSLSELRDRGPEAVRTDCAVEGAACTRALLGHNLAQRSEDGSVPPWPLLIGAGLLLLRRRPGRAPALLLTGATLGAMTVGAAAVLYRPRYALQHAALLAALLPIGAARFGRWGLLAAFAVHLLAWPAPWRGWRLLAADPPVNEAALWAALERRDPWMDCAGLGAEALVLPQRPGAAWNPSGIDARACHGWLRSAPPGARVITADRGGVGGLEPAGAGWAVEGTYDAVTTPLSPALTVWRR